jgi:hypothetical protein
VRIDKKASREEKCKDRAEKEEMIRVFYHEVFKGATETTSQCFHEIGERITQAKNETKSLYDRRPKGYKDAQKRDGNAKQLHHLGDHPKPS